MRRRLLALIQPYRRIVRRNHRRWLADDGELRRTRFSHLDSNSLVFDIGGFEGTWTDAVHERYGCTVHVFEPHPDFAENLMRKYANNPRVTVHPFALGSNDGTLHLSDAGNASSAVSGARAAVTGTVVDVARFLGDLPRHHIDLAKINIEGGEYDLLPALAAAGALPRFRLLQLQFHLFGEADLGRRDAIVAELQRTHRADWSYPFIWEQWSLREG